MLTYLLFQYVLFIQHFVIRILFVVTQGLGFIFSPQYSVTLYKQITFYPLSCSWTPKLFPLFSGYKQSFC